MAAEPVRDLILESLADGIPTITPAAVGYYKENCIVCFHRNGHASGVRLSVHYGDSNAIYRVLWSGKVTEQLLRNYPKVPRVTEDAACAMALFLIRELADFTAIEMSVIGTTIDYYLSLQDQSDTLIFNRAARLEVSGILTESGNNTVDGRINQKSRRLNRNDDLPAFIVVVEFSRPWSKMVEA